MKTTAIISTPALAAAIRETHQREFAASTAQFCAPQRALVQMYRISAGDDVVETDWGRSEFIHDVAEEAHSAATVVSEVAERLRRLAVAYGEWKRFDAPAYFDIPKPQADLLLSISERVSSVHVHFYMDLLLPSFGAAEAYWANHFAPAYHAANIAQLEQPDPADEQRTPPHIQHNTNGAQKWNSVNGTGVSPFTHNAENVFVQDFFAQVQPTMLMHWQRLVAVIQATRTILADDIGYLTTNGGEDERNRHYRHWRGEAAPGLPATLCPPLAEIPTLSLTFVFPLPVHRQSGRQRRLRTNRERHRRWGRDWGT